MKLKDLLTKLSKLEAALHEFSFDRLSVDEAQELKNSLHNFREQLEDKIGQKDDENSVQDLNRVYRFEEEEAKAKADSENPGAQKEITSSPVSGATRFNAYLRESELSQRQLAYINEILEAAEIATRVTNIHIPHTDTEKYESSDHRLTDKKLKTNEMSKPEKRTSEIMKSSKIVHKDTEKLDLKPILEDCLGKVDLLEELIKLYKLNALEFIGKLKIHLQNLDFEAIRFASHKVKSGLRMMNTQELLVIAEQIELGSKTDRDIKHLWFLFDCFVKEYPAVENAIDEEFEKLN